MKKTLEGYTDLTLTVYFNKPASAGDPKHRKLMVALELPTQETPYDNANGCLHQSKHYEADISPDFAMFWYLPKDQHNDIRDRYESMCRQAIAVYENDGIKDIGVAQTYYKGVNDAEHYLEQKLQTTIGERGALVEKVKKISVDGVGVEECERWQALADGKDQKADGYHYYNSLYTKDANPKNPMQLLDALLLRLRSYTKGLV